MGNNYTNIWNTNTTYYTRKSTKNVLGDEVKKSELYKRLGTKHRFIIEMLRPEMNYWVFAIGSEHNGVFGSTVKDYKKLLI